MPGMNFSALQRIDNNRCFPFLLYQVRCAARHGTAHRTVQRKNVKNQNRDQTKEDPIDPTTSMIGNRPEMRHLPCMWTMFVFYRDRTHADTIPVHFSVYTGAYFDTPDTMSAPERLFLHKTNCLRQKSEIEFYIARTGSYYFFGETAIIS